MVGNPIHRWKRPINKTAWKKRPSQNPAKPFADRKHDARKSAAQGKPGAKAYWDKKLWEKTATPTRPAADKSYFKKDARRSARPARGFGDESRFGDGVATSYGAKTYFKKERPSDIPAYGHPAKTHKKVAAKRPDTQKFAEKSERSLGARKFWDRPARWVGAKPEWQRYGHRSKSDKPARPFWWQKSAPARKTYWAVFWDGKPRSKPPRTRKRI